MVAASPISAARTSSRSGTTEECNSEARVCSDAMIDQLRFTAKITSSAIEAIRPSSDPPVTGRTILSRVNEPDGSSDGKAGDQGVVFVINGAATVYYGPQQVGDGGTNVTAGGLASGPLTVTGPGVSATGGQSAQAGQDASVAGRDVGSAAAKGGAAKEGWWARLRERGMMVAFATIVGTIVAVCVWAGWTP